MNITKAKEDLWAAYLEAMKLDLDYVKARVTEWDLKEMVSLSDTKEVEWLMAHLKLLRAGLAAVSEVENQRGEPDHAKGEYKEFRRRVQLEFPGYGSED